jgi:hypothetical protein
MNIYTLRYVISVTAGRGCYMYTVGEREKDYIGGQLFLFIKDFRE